MLEITLSEKYLKELTEAYPDLLKNIAKKGIRGKRFKVFQENVAFCPEIAKALNDVFRSTVDGNSAVMYIDAKIREILSLFLCQSKHKECSSCSCCSPKDNHLFIRAKDIIEKEYLNPPSLRNLALMVGTNECKLKNGFKALFGTTVYAYLFEYRMQQACRLLLGSDMTVQEVGSNIGYEYHSHFSTAFKRKFGISPMEYRMEQAKV
ncbi:MAG: AraC family transcriptional regulator [Prevotellaceae bacterium]|nr:AraC family transcriptional regulator [Prevotellaceae bacterium]